MPARDAVKKAADVGCSDVRDQVEIEFVRLVVNSAVKRMFFAV
jgi:hypothetical protein